MLAPAFWPIASAVVAAASVVGVAAGIRVRRQSRDEQTPLGWLGLALLNGSLLGFCLSTAGGAWWLMSRHSDQRRERAADAWIAKLGSADLDERTDACIALGDARAARALTPLTERLGDEHPDVQRAALWALNRIGSSAAGTAPRIARMLVDDEVSALTRDVAFETLESFGPEAVAPLRRSLGQPDRALAAGAGRALANLGPPGHAALGSALRRGTAAERAGALLGLYHHGGVIPVVMPAVRALVGDAHPHVRWVACATWTKLDSKSARADPRFWPAIAETLPRWISVTKDFDDPIRQPVASELLWEAGRRPDELRRPLMAALQDTQAQAAALEHAADLGGVPVGELDTVVGLLRNHQTRNLASLYLLQAGPEAVPALARFAADRQNASLARDEAWRLLKILRPLAARAVADRQRAERLGNPR